MANQHELLERMRYNDQQKWYLLFDDMSEDGKGSPKYIGRTLLKQEAIRHLRKVKANPYSIGNVMIVTPDRMFSAMNESDL
jgi:hypothetical protein